MQSTQWRLHCTRVCGIPDLKKHRHLAFFSGNDAKEKVYLRKKEEQLMGDLGQLRGDLGQLRRKEEKIRDEKLKAQEQPPSPKRRRYGMVHCCLTCLKLWYSCRPSDLGPCIESIQTQLCSTPKSGHLTNQNSSLITTPSHTNKTLARTITTRTMGKAWNRGY